MFSVYHYPPLLQILNGDIVTLLLLVTLSIGNLVVHLLITRSICGYLTDCQTTETRRAVKELQRLFVVTSIVAYGFNLISVWYPLWPLRVLLMGCAMYNGILYLSYLRSGVIVFYGSAKPRKETRPPINVGPASERLDGLISLAENIRVAIDQCERVSANSKR